MQIELLRAATAHGHDLRARSGGMREFTVHLDQFSGRPAAVETSQQNRGGGFDHGNGRAAQNVGKTDVRGLVAETHGVRQARVRMKFHKELRRAALAS
jgi:hypothetical protein